MPFPWVLLIVLVLAWIACLAPLALSTRRAMRADLAPLTSALKLANSRMRLALSLHDVRYMRRKPR